LLFLLSRYNRKRIPKARWQRVRIQRGFHLTTNLVHNGLPAKNDLDSIFPINHKSPININTKNKSRWRLPAKVGRKQKQDDDLKQIGKYYDNSLPFLRYILGWLPDFGINVQLAMSVWSMIKYISFAINWINSISYSRFRFFPSPCRSAMAASNFRFCVVTFWKTGADLSKLGNTMNRTELPRR